VDVIIMIMWVDKAYYSHFKPSFINPSYISTS